MGDLKIIATPQTTTYQLNKVKKENSGEVAPNSKDNVINASGQISVADIQGAKGKADVFVATKEGDNVVLRKLDLKSNPAFLDNLIKKVQSDPNFRLESGNFLSPPPPPTPVTEADGTKIKASLETPAFKDVLAHPTQETMLGSDFGKNILLQTGIKNSDDIKTMTPEEKGTVAFNFGLAAVRDDVKTKGDNSELFKQVKAQYPKLSDTDIKTLVDPDMEVGAKSRSVSPEARAVLQSPAFQMQITQAIQTKSAPFYKALGGEGTMPTQYLAATGNGNQTQGVAASDVRDHGVGSGYFMYDFKSKTTSNINVTGPRCEAIPMKTDSMLNNKNLSISFPDGDDLRVKLSTYGSEATATGENRLNLKIGTLDIKGTVQNNKISLKPPAPNEDKAFDKFCADNRKTPNEGAYREYLKAEKGVEIDDRQNITFHQEKFPTRPNLSVQYQCFSNVGSFNDETQLQIATNSTISNGAPVKADGLFGTDLFTADKSLLKPEEAKNFKALSKAVPDSLIGDLKSHKPVDASSVFVLEGGGVNTTDPNFQKDIDRNKGNKTELNKTYDQMRSSYATPDVNAKGDPVIKINSYTDPRQTTLKDGMASVPPDKAKKLEAAFKAQGIGLNNSSLSALRTASFAKALMQEKDPGLKAEDFANATIQVQVEGKKVTLSLADVPPY